MTHAPAQSERGRHQSVRRRADRASAWSIATLIICLVLLGPFVALIIKATGDSEGLWPHLMATVFPRYAANTVLLMIGVGALTLFFGISSAWAVSRYRFPGVRLLSWALLLPATVPAYVIAYTYTDLLEFAGPVQSAFRAVFGWTTVREYWFPEIRSMGGAVLVMGSVLYPYVYVMARAAFRMTPASFYEVAMNHDRNLLISVGLPLARPAIVAGVALVLMEVISDFGTVEFFAVETLTLGSFNIWLGMNNLTAAAQIACVAFIFILTLLVIERAARRRQRFTDTGVRHSGLASVEANGPKATLCLFVCLLPIVLGFVIPVGVLLVFVLRGLAITDYGALAINALHSVTLAVGVAFIVITLAMLTVLVTTYQRHPMLRVMAGLSAMGYAFPGTVLAIGVVAFAGGVDTVAQYVTELLGLDFEGFLIGSTALLMLGLVVRFQAIGYGSMLSGVKRLSPNLMSASFSLGQSFSTSAVTIATPLLMRPILAAGLLVFVDVMKELPMSLLLRPFDYETLATYVYQYAKDELLEQSALAALAIVAAGLGPVLLLNNYERQSVHS